MSGRQEPGGGGLLLRIWGAGGSAPTGRTERAHYGGDTVCFEIRREAPGATPLIIDLGTGARDLGRALTAEAEADNQPPRAEILISHLHLDHIVGAPFFGPFYDSEAELRLRCGLEGDVARRSLRCFAAPPFFPVRPLEMGAARWGAFRPGEPFEAAGLTVTPIRLNHPGGCCGFRVEGPEGALVIVGDHEHGDPQIDAEVTRAAAGAALMLYDGTYDEYEYVHRHGWGHSTWEMGAEIARAAGVGETLFYHHQPELSDAELARRDEQVQDACRGRLARQGMVWRIRDGKARPA
ncbi:MAG: MBL fold metallo-hydrolase [Pseudomonadota bacterium]